MGLIWQVIFYQRLTGSHLAEEEVTLIQGNGQRRRRSSESTHHTVSFWFNTLSGLSIVLVTILSCVWYASVHGGLIIGFKGGDTIKDFHWLPQLLGWTSAVLYVGSRIPQIVKNHRQKSTEGLSIGMFLCAVLGNVLFTMVTIENACSDMNCLTDRCFLCTFLVVGVCPLVYLFTL
jgi:hypothetical protein